MTFDRQANHYAANGVTPNVVKFLKIKQYGLWIMAAASGKRVFHHFICHIVSFRSWRIIPFEYKR